MSNIRGLEILYALVVDKIQSKADCLVVVFHCMMIKDGHTCVGSGDDWPASTSESTSELLPEDWNSNQEVYSLRYISSNSSVRYLLKIVKTGNSLLINLFNVNGEESSGACVNIDNHVTDDFKKFKTAFKDLEGVKDKFQNEVLNEIQLKIRDASKKPGTSEQKKSETSEQKKSETSEQKKSDTSLEFENDPFYEYRLPPPTTSAHRYERPFPIGQVGRDDLDPFSRGHGGGMLFDPSNFGVPARPGLPHFGIGGPGGLPRGAVPPGARFDPFGPPMSGRGRSTDPDPDHLPPPGFSDSFM